MDPDILPCVICTTSTSNFFPEHNQQSNFGTDGHLENTTTTTTLLKLLGLTEDQDDIGDLVSESEDFQELPFLLCFQCKSKIQEIHETFTQLRNLQNQIKTFREEIKGEILRSHTTKLLDYQFGKYSFQKADFVRSKIVQRLNVQDFPCSGDSNIPILSDQSQDHAQQDSESQSLLLEIPSATEATVCQSDGEGQDPILKDLRIVLHRIDEGDPNFYLRKRTKKGKRKIVGRRPRNVMPNHTEEVEPRDEPEPDPDWNVQDQDYCGDEGDFGTNDSDYEYPGPQSPTGDMEITKNTDISKDPIDESKPKKKSRAKIGEIGSDGLCRCPFPGCTSRLRYTPEMLRVHNRRVHENIPPKRKPPPKCTDPPTHCTFPGCTSTLKYSKSSLQCHIRNIHKGMKRPKTVKLRECPEPGCTSKVRYTERRLLAHIQRNHRNIPQRPLPVQCDMCGEVLSSQKVLLSHQRKHTGERFPCDICLSEFRTVLGLSDHKKRHDGALFRTFVCDLCGMGFMKIKHFEMHMKRHNDKPDFKCRICPRQFMTKYDLNNHESFAHGKELKLEKVQAKCDECGKLYSTKASLKIHKRMAHKKEFRFPCTEPGCEYKTDRRCDLKEHLITHSTETPFHCEVDGCGKRFKLKRRLDEHARTHKDQDPNECSVCHKRFSKRSYLIRHQLDQHKVVLAEDIPIL